MAEEMGTATPSKRYISPFARDVIWVTQRCDVNHSATQDGLVKCTRLDRMSLTVSEVNCS